MREETVSNSDEDSVATDPRIGLASKRTSMASFRTQLALDRTTLAWIRTTLGLAGFGFGMVGFFRTLREKSPSPETLRLHQGAIFVGTMLVILGIAAMLLACASHWSALQRLHRGEPPVLTSWPLTITVGFLLAIVGLAGLWVLFV